MTPYRSFDGLTARPDPADRLFTSHALEEAITATSSLIADAGLRRMFEQCLPNTLDTTVYFDDSDGPDTYIATGDIPAMWLRDSTNQVWPYIRFLKSDPTLQKLFHGLIRRQASYILTDAYANAFIDNDIVPDARGGAVTDEEAEKGVWERKFELDTLASFLRLSAGYYAYSKDTAPFDATWLRAVSRVYEVMSAEQADVTRHNIDELYNFPHPATRLQGYGYPGRNVGLVRSVFRPSDDESVFPYNIPANAMAAVNLRQTAKLLEHLSQPKLSANLATLAAEITAGIRNYGIVNHGHDRVYAYEVDGFGSAAILDDPNAPGLLSLEYIGFVKPGDPVYLATRRLALSEANPFYASGKAASGLTSAHTGVLTHVWPIGTIMQAATSTDEAEITACLRQLRNTHADTFFIHESVHVD
ncbi:MAG: Tat pathway signal protein, partial [Candidatus Saccharibacteria bacterium]|nr:Tat pathway signal protein [Candidatus Saccharibacteria bacterium]